jgi:hypothetical protein
VLDANDPNKYDYGLPSIQKPTDDDINPDEVAGLNPEVADGNVNKGYYSTFYNEYGKLVTDTRKAYDTKEEAELQAKYA